MKYIGVHEWGEVGQGGAKWGLGILLNFLLFGTKY
jgi:hypothetical protein